jgi:quercetin dioxygenase-like cupin family protein
MNKFAKKIMPVKTVVEYQSDAIVSKELIKKDSGTVSFFAFDAGQGLSEHTVPYDALVFVTEGEGEIVINNETFTLSAGNMIIMPAHEPHRVCATKPFKMLLALVK